jgi:hypothetical protein
MKIVIILIAAFLGLASPVKADAKSESLTSKYESACARALEPIQKVYETELKRLMEEQFRNGNIAEVNAIQKKLTELQAVMNKKDDSDLVKQFVGKRLKNAGGVIIEFKTDGVGVLHAEGTLVPFSWIVDGDLIKTHGAARNGMAEKDMWFKFKDRRSAFYGNAKDALTLPLTVE